MPTKIKPIVLERMHFVTTLAEFVSKFNLFRTFLYDVGSAYFLMWMRVGILPVQLVFSIAASVISWIQFYNKNYDGYSLFRALFDTLIAAAMLVLLVSAFAAVSIFVLVSPIVYACVFAAQSLFSLCSAIYFKIKAEYARDPEIKSYYNNRASIALIESFFGFAITGLFAAAMFFAGPATIIITSLLGMGCCIAAVIATRAIAGNTLVNDETEEASTPVILATLGVENAAEQTNQTELKDEVIYAETPPPGRTVFFNREWEELKRDPNYDYLSYSRCSLAGKQA